MNSITNAIKNLVPSLGTNALPSFSKVAMLWIGIGSASGALISGFDKMCQIGEEPTPKYKNAFVERPIRGVYHASRVAANSGWGAFIGGFTAATAPVSIPLYIYWQNDIGESEVSDSR